MKITANVRRVVLEAAQSGDWFPVTVMPDASLGYVLYDTRPAPMVLLDHYESRSEAEYVRRLASDLYAKKLA